MLAYFENTNSGKLYDHFKKFGYTVDSKGIADICISINEAKGRLPSGKLLVSYMNQSFFIDGEDYLYSIHSSIAGCVYGKARAPFFDVQIFCDYPDMECGNKAMLEVLLQFFRYRSLYLGNLLIHASAIVAHKGGIAFSGSSGDGKSTQASLWIKYQNAYMLNDDKPIIHLEQDQVYITGSPWSGKGNSYLNESHPLRGVIFLKKAHENALHKLTLRESYSYFYLNNMPYFLNDEIEILYDEVVKKYANQVSAYLLECRPDYSATTLVYDQVLKEGTNRAY